VKNRSELAGSATTLAELEVDALLDTAVDAVIVIDRHGLIRRFNDAAERMFGYDASQVLGRDVALLMPEPHRSRHASYIERYLQTGAAHVLGYGREVGARRRDGTVFPAELAIGELRAGDAQLFVGFVRDLTLRNQQEVERQRAEEELQRARDRLVHVGRLSTMGEMAAGLAHEINQPLAAISMYARAGMRLLERSSEPAKDELREALEGISAQALRAGEVIRRIRAMVKPGTSERRTVDCNRLVSELIALAEPDARTNDIEMRVHRASMPLPVHVDTVQVQQVLLNLVRNAIDAIIVGTRGARRIDVRASMKDGETAELSVVDSGCGLPGEPHERLFEPFFTTKAAGTGLGLSISRNIVRDHGGRLTCAENPDGGAVFAFTLPLHPEDSE
jgi:two-component system sensor kinase FixL